MARTSRKVGDVVCVRYRSEDPIGFTRLRCTVKAIHSRRRDYTVEDSHGIRLIVTDAQIEPSKGKQHGTT